MPLVAAGAVVVMMMALAHVRPRPSRGDEARPDYTGCGFPGRLGGEAPNGQAGPGLLEAVSVPRVLLALAFSLHLGLGGGVVSYVEEEPCSDGCPEDGPDGKCPPNCPECACCPHAGPVVVSAEVVAADPAPRAAAPELELSAPAAPEPRDILHDPRAALA